MSTNASGAGTQLSQRVAEEIRSWMGRRRMSGAELARRLKVSSAWVSYRLTGTQEIGLNDLEHIATALNVEVADLMPRPSEGRVLPVGAGRTEEQERGITIRKFGLTNRPGPSGHPKRAQPDPSTRRPARIRAAHAPS